MKSLIHETPLCSQIFTGKWRSRLKVNEGQVIFICRKSLCSVTFICSLPEYDFYHFPNTYHKTPILVKNLFFVSLQTKCWNQFQISNSPSIQSHLITHFLSYVFQISILLSSALSQFQLFRFWNPYFFDCMSNPLSISLLLFQFHRKIAEDCCSWIWGKRYVFLLWNL
jgi:hypothetical protein